MRKPVPPCKECDNRKLGCHTDCRRYREYGIDKEVYKQRISEYKHSEAEEYKQDGIRGRQKRYGKKKTKKR